MHVPARNDIAEGTAAIERAAAIAEGVAFAKDLGNLPSNICTPTYLAEQAVEMGRNDGVRVEVLEQKAVEKLGMGAFLAVARGSREPPQVHRHGIPRRQARGPAGGPGGQGHHVRYRRHLHQARAARWTR